MNVKPTTRYYKLVTTDCNNFTVYYFESVNTIANSAEYTAVTITFNRVIEDAIRFAIRMLHTRKLKTVVIDLPKYRSIVTISKVDSIMRYSVECNHKNVNVSLIKMYCDNNNSNVKISITGRYNENSFRGKWFKFWFKRW